MRWQLSEILISGGVEGCYISSELEKVLSGHRGQAYFPARNQGSGLCQLYEKEQTKDLPRANKI